VISIDVGVGLDVANDGRDPERGDSELDDVVEVLAHALPVAALVPRERAGTHHEVVVDAAVGETIDEHLVDHLVAPIGNVGGDDRLFAFGGDVDTSGLGDEGAHEGERGEDKAGTHGKPHGYELELNHHSTPRPA
jgi:hypothetical protein